MSLSLFYFENANLKYKLTVSLLFKPLTINVPSYRNQSTDQLLKLGRKNTAFTFLHVTF